jgi:hypothetical protein
MQFCRRLIAVLAAVSLLASGEAWAASSRSLHVPYHPQSTDVWCWAATIAMVAEYFNHEPVSDCDVADRLDRVNGGGGVCCSHGRPDNSVCFRGRRDMAMIEVMKWYFHLDPVEFHRPLTFEEIKGSIDAGYPIIAKLVVRPGWGHVIVIDGYDKNQMLQVKDPWAKGGNHNGPRSYEALLNRRGFPRWVGTFYFKPDVLAGHIDGAAPHEAKDDPLPEGPARSSVTAKLPGEMDASVRKQVEAAVAKKMPYAIACYDAALAKSPPAAASMRLSFSVTGGTPSWIMVKDAGGLPSQVTSCVSDVVAKWAGLFPKKGQYAESQFLDLSFTRLDADAAR